MTEDQDAKESHSDLGNKILANKSKDKKTRAQRPLTKIIMRRLPPTMTEESFLEQVSPIPDHDHFYFAKPDPSLANNLFSRAYINFVNEEDIYLFKDKFDGYVFLDEKGVEYIGIVEYAPFQRIPKKKKKKDPKCGTIESDPIYQEFLESLEKDPETENQPKLEYSYPIGDGSDKKVQSTPLLEYLAARKQDKRGRDERRRRENDKRKMRIERKTKEPSIKINEDVSEDEIHNDVHEHVGPRFWAGEERVYHKSKMKHNKHSDSLNICKSETNAVNSNWDNNFPALSAKTHSAFTLSSDKQLVKKEAPETSQKSAGDTCLKEDEAGENEVKKIKPRDWEKDKAATKEDVKEKDGVTVFESKTYRDRDRKGMNSVDKKKGGDKKDDEPTDDGDRAKRDRKDRVKESPREQKSKKYSDTRKERIRSNEITKTDKPVAKPESKVKALNHDDIKPFTQLPHVRTDDLTKLIEEMDRKVKLEEKGKGVSEDSVVRRNSIDYGEDSLREQPELKRQKSLDERGRSSEREGEERDRDAERRAERRIRNKDRPSMVIYQPGMGRFSKQRLAKDKDPAKPVSDSEKKDT
ncbi:regulator of nonsense transcripts 3B isoform X1 [Plutella xylostella]|uniref:regulator of nonsense transcripts 3B isoform X1 n=1 Tax=Plutella xylostella TaxID=51655 RepID=UPI002032F516|nr:regulator of nonsense transcripts 3B isoform X1 [Plutella xylostella]